MKIKKEVSLLNHKVVFDYHKRDDLCVLTAFINDDKYFCIFNQKRLEASLLGLPAFIVQTFIKNGWLNNLSQIDEIYSVVNNAIDLPTEDKKLDLIKLEQVFDQNVFYALAPGILILRLFHKEEYFFNISNLQNINKLYKLHEIILSKLVYEGKIFSLHDAKLMHHVIAKMLKNLKVII